MPSLDEEAALRQLPVLQQLDRRVHTAADDASACERQEDLVGAPGLRIARQERHALGHHLGVGPLVQVGRPGVRRDVEHLAEERLGARVTDQHRHPAVRAGHDADAALGAAFAQLVAAGVLRAQVGQDGGQGLEAGHLDEVAVAGALAGEEGRQRAHEGVDAHNVVDQPARRAQRRTPRLAVQRQVPRQGLQDEVAAAVVGVGTVGAEVAQLDDHQIGARPTKFLDRQAGQGGRRAASHDQHVGRRGQPRDAGARHRRAVHPALAGSDVLPHQRTLARTEARERRHAPDRRAALALHDKHLSAPQGELAPAIGAGQVVAELQHAEPGEWLRRRRVHGWPPRLRANLAGQVSIGVMPGSAFAIARW